MGWLYSERFPSILILHQPRYTLDEDLEEIALDMDAEYDDAWLYARITKDVLTDIRTFRGSAAKGVHPYHLFPWAHDREALARILPVKKRRAYVPGQGVVTIED